MAVQKISELREKSPQDLRDMLGKERARLRDLRFRLAGAQLKTVHEISDSRRRIARISTVLREIKSQNTNHE